MPQGRLFGRTSLRESSIHGELRVLVLSSDAQCRQLVRNAIACERHLHALIAECEDSSCAASQLKDRDFDLIVLDSSLQETKWCVENGRSAAVVFLANSSPIPTVQEVLATGATDCITKIEHVNEPATLWLALRQSVRYHSVLRSRNHLAEILHERDAVITKLSQRLWRDAPYDFRTGWFSHREVATRMHEELHRAVRYKLPFSIILGDMNGIGQLERDRGEHFVDALFAQVSARIRGLCRQSDVVGHYGEEAFLVLLTNTETNGARRFCQRLNVSFEKPLSVGNEEASLKLTFGIAARDLSDEITVTQLLQTAETHLEKARLENPPQGFVVD